MADRPYNICLAVLGLLLFAAAPATGRTWTVEKDGSGDYNVIQEAIDVAAEGDTIRIGDGRFEEYAFAVNNGDDFYANMFIETDDLTIIGNGASSTAIGFEDYDADYVNVIYGVIGLLEIDAKIEGVSISGAQVGVYWAGGNLHARQVLLRACSYGAYLKCAGSFVDCDITSYEERGVFFRDSQTGFLFDNCRFFDCEYCGTSIGTMYSTGIEIIDTLFDRIHVAIQVTHGSSAIIRGVQVQNITHTSVVGSVSSDVQIDECDLSGENVLDYDGTGSMRVRNSTLQGGSYSVILTFGNALDIHNCRILNGGGMSVITRQDSDGLAEPLVLDMSNNDWGTMDTDQLDAWIDDYHDYHPLEGNHWVIVEYEPMLEDTVPVNQPSLTDVRELFR